MIDGERVALFFAMQCIEDLDVMKMRRTLERGKKKVMMVNHPTNVDVIPTAP